VYKVHTSKFIKTSFSHAIISRNGMQTTFNNSVAILFQLCSALLDNY